MSTGYTASIGNGISFNDFVWKCARGMGALVSMRDEPSDAPIPERFEPSDYHVIKIKEAEDNLVRLRALSGDEIEKETQIANNKAIEQNTAGIRKNDELREKYESMLKQVRSWNPPTSDHEGFKKFMIEQITSSIEFDCGNSYYIENKPKLLTGKQWLDNAIKEELHDIAYHTKEYSKEVERTESRNKWLQDLRQSLINHDQI